MVRIAHFTPSDDVLDAIRSLRADDDGLEPLQRETETAETFATGDASPRPNNPLIARYDFTPTGRYLRVKV